MAASGCGHVGAGRDPARAGVPEGAAHAGGAMRGGDGGDRVGEHPQPRGEQPSVKTGDTTALTTRLSSAGRALPDAAVQRALGAARAPCLQRGLVGDARVAERGAVRAPAEPPRRGRRRREPGVDAGGGRGRRLCRLRDAGRGRAVPRGVDGCLGCVAPGGLGAAAAVRRLPRRARRVREA